MKRRDFLRVLSMAGAAAIGGCVSPVKIGKASSREKPNILLCIADDWGWPHAGAYGDTEVKTPVFDSVARNGVLFEYAYVSSPSCTPSRNALLTGQFHWRLKEGANLLSTLDVNTPVFPLLLSHAGYHVGHWRKSWGPGNLKAGGYIDTHPAGPEYKGFQEFLSEKPDGIPFCFILGSPDPHRPYVKGSGKKSGIDLDRIKLPAFYPDCEEIRSDIADYYYEVQRFNEDCGKAIDLLESKNLLDDTIVIITGDNGMPFPRCKSNIYDMGVHVPLAIQWKNRIKGKRRVKDFVSLTDLAPTFLEAAGVAIPAEMTGKSLLHILLSHKDGLVDKSRTYVLFGKERHTVAQKSPSLEGYPCRGLRTEQFLYLLNLAPHRWPAGVPEGATSSMKSYTDCDKGPSRQYLIDHRDDPACRPYFELAFAKRPAEELYDLANDPDQINNVAGDPQFASVKNSLSKKLLAELRKTADPRVIGGGEKFDSYPYPAK